MAFMGRYAGPKEFPFGYTELSLWFSRGEEMKWDQARPGVREDIICVMFDLNSIFE